MYQYDVYFGVEKRWYCNLNVIILMIIFYNFTFNHFLLINHTYFSNGFSSSTFFLIKKGWNPINFQQKIKERTNIFILYNHHLLRHHLVCWIAWLLEVLHRINHNEILSFCDIIVLCCLLRVSHNRSINLLKLEHYNILHVLMIGIHLTSY